MSAYPQEVAAGETFEVPVVVEEPAVVSFAFDVDGSVTFGIMFQQRAPQGSTAQGSMQLLPPSVHSEHSGEAVLPGKGTCLLQWHNPAGWLFSSPITLNYGVEVQGQGEGGLRHKKRQNIEARSARASPALGGRQTRCEEAASEEGAATLTSATAKAERAASRLIVTRQKSAEIARAAVQAVRRRAAAEAAEAAAAAGRGETLQRAAAAAAAQEKNIRQAAAAIAAAAVAVVVCTADPSKAAFEVRYGKPGVDGNGTDGSADVSADEPVVTSADDHRPAPTQHQPTEHQRTPALPTVEVRADSPDHLLHHLPITCLITCLVT